MTKETLEKTDDEIMSEWQEEEFEGCFAARHIADDKENKENCLLLYVDENDEVRAPNWAQWVRHMVNDQKYTPSQISEYQYKLKEDFERFMFLTLTKEQENSQSLSALKEQKAAAR